MQLLKFSLIIMISSPLFAFEKKDCLDSNFDLTISHKAQPFGLLEKIITVKKNKCEISINHTKFKYLKSKWIIDVCRDPVHIKKKLASLSVIRREKPCSSKDKSSFCKHWHCIRGKIQNDGLVFAKGEKEDITTDYGKLYCAYTLLYNYLANGKVLSRTVPNFDLPRPEPMKEKSDEQSEPTPEQEGVSGSF